MFSSNMIVAKPEPEFKGYPQTDEVRKKVLEAFTKMAKIRDKIIKECVKHITSYKTRMCCCGDGRRVDGIKIITLLWLNNSEENTIRDIKSVSLRKGKDSGLVYSKTVGNSFIDISFSRGKRIIMNIGMVYIFSNANERNAFVGRHIDNHDEMEKCLEEYAEKALDNFLLMAERKIRRRA